MFSGRGRERHKDGPEWSPPAGWEPELGGVKELAVEEDEEDQVRCACACVTSSTEINRILLARPRVRDAQP